LEGKVEGLKEDKRGLEKELEQGKAALESQKKEMRWEIEDLT